VVVVVDGVVRCVLDFNNESIPWYIGLLMVREKKKEGSKFFAFVSAV
jgi:hypothetical protein